jgi:protein-tyrosine phosphatase
MTFRILVVCAANVCRSPLAAAVTTHSLAMNAAGRVVEVDTAGTEAQPGVPVCADVVRMAGARGLHPRALPVHVAHPVTLDQVEAADLVLTADRRVRSSIVKRAPQAGERTFTLREAANLGEHAAREVEGRFMDARLRSYVSAMNASRGLTDLPRTRHLVSRPWRPVAVHAHDIPDAHQAERASHRAVYHLTVAAARQVTEGLVACTEAANR